MAGRMVAGRWKTFGLSGSRGRPVADPAPATQAHAGWCSARINLLL